MSSTNTEQKDELTSDISQAKYNRRYYRLMQEVSFGIQKKWWDGIGQDVR